MNSTPILSGNRLTPARLNTNWQSYTPAWTAATTNPTLGNGTLTGRYRYLDPKTVLVWIRLAVGSTTTVGTGQYRFSLPVPAVAGGPDPQLEATALQGGALYRYLGWANTATASADGVLMYRTNINSQENLASWTNAVPVALASGHAMSMTGIYIVAL